MLPRRGDRLLERVANVGLLNDHQNRRHDRCGKPKAHQGDRRARGGDVRQADVRQTSGPAN